MKAGMFKTGANLNKIVTNLKSLGMVAIRKSGRESIYILTAKGAVKASSVFYQFTMAYEKI